MNGTNLNPLLRNKISSRLQRITNVLLLNASFIDNLGLLNGKMGIAIFFYHYSRYTNSKIHEDFAGELIDEIYEEINTNTTVNFENGLTGIGWGIEYLVINGFIEAETDEILDDIDKRVYQKIQFEFDSDELAGFLLYQLARFNSKNTRTAQKELLINHTILCLLVECEKLLVYRNFNGQNDFPDLSTIETIQYFLSEIEKASLFPEKSKKLLDILPSFIEIANSHKETGKQSLVESAASLAWQQLTYPFDIDSGTDINPMFREAFEFIDEEENWNRQLDTLDINNLGLKGFSGLGLGLYFLAESMGPKGTELRAQGVLSQKEMLVFQSGKRNDKQLTNS